MATTDQDLDLLTEKLSTLQSLAQQVGVSDPLDLVQVLRMLAETAESAQRQAVPLAVADGASWSEVGRVLGVSKQAAWERYGARYDEARP